MIKDFDDVDVGSLSADERKSYADDIIADFRDKVVPGASGRVKSPRVDALIGLPQIHRLKARD